MNIVDISIQYHSEFIEKWAEYKLKVGGGNILFGSIWVINVEYDRSTLHGPYYLKKDAVYLHNTLKQKYNKLESYVKPNTMTISVCYFNLYNTGSIFNFYQKDKKWLFLSSRVKSSSQ